MHVLENSRDNALDWDRIRNVSYDNINYITEPLVDNLTSAFYYDIKNDSSFINYLSFVEETRKNRKKKSISLNYNKRLNEKKNNDSKSNNLNTSVEISEIFPVKEEDLLKKIKNDLYLRESIKLFVEMLRFKES